MKEAMSTQDENITERLVQAAKGDKSAEGPLYDLVYDQLHRIARGQRSKRGPAARSLGTTEIVHEVYLKVAGGQAQDFENRGHFFAVATVAMRNLLFDQARRRLSAKRRGDEEAVSYDDAIGVEERQEAEQLLALKIALEKLDDEDARLRQVVELRFFGGLSEVEAAHVLDVAPRTIRRDWVRARAWLRAHLGEGAA